MINGELERMKWWEEIPDERAAPTKGSTSPIAQFLITEFDGFGFPKGYGALCSMFLIQFFVWWLCDHVNDVRWVLMTGTSSQVNTFWRWIITRSERRKFIIKLRSSTECRRMKAAFGQLSWSPLCSAVLTRKRQAQSRPFHLLCNFQVKRLK